MDAISTEAVNALQLAITGLLPPVAAPVLPSVVHIYPTQIATTGIGGFVGINQNPIGEIKGRRVSAKVLIDVRATTAEALDTAVSNTAVALLAADRATLTQQGILRLALGEVGERSVVGAGADVTVQKRMTFSALFEFLKLPADGEGVIRQIPININAQ